MATTTTGIKLDKDTKARLEALGKLRDRSPHWLMKRAILEYIEREEKLETEKQEDEARWQEYLRTGEVIPHAQVEEWIDREIARLSAQTDKPA